MPIIGSTDTIAPNSTGVTLYSPGMESIQSATIGGLAGYSFVKVTTGEFTFSFPKRVHGVAYPPYGTNAISITDGTTTLNGNVDIVARSNENLTTITSVAGTGEGYLQHYLSLAVGDVVAFATPASLAVTANAISATGLITTDYVGTQNVWVRKAATGLMYRATITTGVVYTTPDVFTFTRVTGATKSATVTSNAITVSGAVGSLAISVTGGTYNINGGTYTSTSGTVVNGDVVTVQAVASSLDLTGVDATLTIGAISDTFNVVTSSLVIADTTPSAFTFTDATNQTISSVIESNVITVTGVDAATNVPISITGGEYAIDTGGGFGAWTSTSGNVQLGYTVKVRGTSSASYSTAVNVVLTVGGVVDTFTIATEASIIPTISSINSGSVRVGSTGNTLVTANYASVTGLTIGGVAATAIAGSGNNRTFNFPDYNIGGILPAFGTVSAVATDGTTPSNINVNFQPKSTQSYVTLTSVGSGAGFVSAYTTCAIGDQIVFDLPATLSATTNSVSVTGAISTDYIGTQTMWHRNGSTGVMTQLSVVTTDTAPDGYTFTDVTGQTRSAVIESNVITIAGVTAATNVPISITGGEYAINTGGGFGAFTASAGNVQLGYTVKVRGTASASYSTATNVVLSVGGVTDTFTITTLAAPAPTLASINSGTVRADSTGNTVVTTTLPSATGLTLGGIAVTALTGSNNAFTFSAPVLAGGASFPAFGTVTAVITDGTSSPSLSVSFQPKVTQGYITLTSSINTAGYVGNYITSVAGDQIVFDLPATLGVTANGVGADGRLFSDYSGTQTMWHRNGTTGLITELSVITPAVASDTVPTAFTFTDQTGAEFSTVTTSNTITVAGIDTASPISITGGTYSKNGGAYTSTAGTVLVGDTVAVRITSSTSPSTAVNATLSIGGVTDTFTVTTRAYDTVPTAFTFTAVSSATISTQYVSNSITVAGVDAGVNVPISITGGEYAINTGSGFGAFVSAAGNVQLGHQVQTRVTSSASGNTSVSATLNIGTVTAVYSVSTGVLDLTPDAFTFTSATGTEVSAVTESGIVTVAGMTAGVDVAISVTNGEYAINSGGGFGAFTASGGVIRNGYTVKVRSAASASYATPKVVTLDIGGVTGTFTISTRVADTTPSPFNFTAQTGAEPSAVSTSNTITVAGIDAAVPVNISVTGGLYSKNGGAYTATSGTVVLGDTVTARLTASAGFNTASTATVTIGGVPDVFSVTTRVADTTPVAVVFTTANSAEPSALAVSNDTVISGVDNGVNINISVTNCEYSINSGSGFGAYTTTAGVIQGGWGLRVRVAASATFGGASTGTVTVGGVQSTFTVNTRAADTTPTAVSFTAATGAPLNTATTSNTVTVAGVDAGVDVSISIANGLYSRNGGAFTSTAGVVRLGDTVAVRRNSSTSNSTAVSTTLTMGGVDSTFVITTAAPADITPDAFSFTDQTSVGLGAVVTSNVIAVQGTTAGVDVPVSITGGEYSIDPDTGVWGAYTTNAGVIRYNHQIRVRGTSSASPSTTTNVILNIGGVTDTFSITTRVADTTPTPFTFTDQTGAATSTVVTSNAITVAGVDAAIPVNITVTGGQYSVNGGTFTATAGTVVLGDVVRTRLTTSNLEATAALSTVTIGGVTDIFSVTTVLTVDDQPNPVTLVLGSTIFESEEFVITGVTPGAPVTISVTDCEYAIDSGSGFGAYTGLDGVVYLNDIVKARMATMGPVVESASGIVTLGDGSYTYTVTVTGGTPPADTTPDTFIVQPVPNAAISTLVESQPFAIAGVDAGEDISVTVSGVEWASSRNGVWGAFRSTAGNVRLGDEVRVRVMSSGTINGIVSGTVTVGGVTGTFTVTATTSMDTTPDAFSFANVGELEPSEDVSSTVVTLAGISTSAVVNCNVTNGSYSVNSGAGWGPWLTVQSTVRLGYRIRLKGRANRLKGGTTVVGLNIGGVSTNWTLLTTSKTVSSSSTTTKYSSFTYPVQPASTAVRDRILTLTETLVPTSITATVRRKAIWNDVLDLVRYTDYTLPAMPAIDFTGFAYRNLPSLLLAVNSAGGSSSFRADYHAAMEYIVRECWQELTLLMAGQADCTVNGVVIRTPYITLQCITKS
jgi:hypothetical protein